MHKVFLQMGLGKTITCVSLIAATLKSAQEFAASPLQMNRRPACGNGESRLTATHFSGSVWGMPDVSDAGQSAKEKAKAVKAQERLDADLARASRIKTKSRATLIVCPLSTVANWEDQFREHWRGEVTVVGGAGGVSAPLASHAHTSLQSSVSADIKPNTNTPIARAREGRHLRVYVYHGNARRPEPDFLADFDAVITTYATLASEFSRQNRSIASADVDDDEEDGSSDGGGIDIDERGNQVLRLPKAKKAGLKRKKSGLLGNSTIESSSPLQSIHWFRVVLDEAK
jgi:SWI/SNF-related matrix-associated actin-dependent regulator of chromatin subfamily A3